MIRRVLPLIALAAVYVVVGSCGRDLTGLDTRVGSLALAPQFENSVASVIIDVAAVRVRLVRPSTSARVLDTVVVFPAGSDSIALTLRFPVESASELLTLTLAMTNAAGDTVFRAGPITVTATAGSTPPPVATPDLVYVGVGADAAGVRFVNPPATAGFNETVPIVAEAFDGQGAAIIGTPIGFELLTPADSTRAGFADAGIGSLITRTVRGPVQIRAFLLSGPSVLHTLSVQPTASAIQIVSGNDQLGSVGLPLAAPMVARVVALDALGVVGVPVDFRVIRGADTLVTVGVISDSAGLVAMTPTLDTMPGVHSISATVVGVAGAVVNFTATSQPGAATTLRFTGEPSDVLPATVMTPAVQVTAFDQFGNVASAFTGPVDIGMLENPQGAVLSGTVSRTALAGVATFDDLQLTGIGTDLTMIAGAVGLVPDTSAAFSITIGAPARVVIIDEPTSTAAAATITPPVRVAIRDANGNTVPSATDVVTLSILSNPGGLGILTGTASVAAVAGVATFSGLSIAQAAAGYTFLASVAGLTPDTSVAFNVTVGAATQLAFTVQPPLATSSATPFAVQVAARDPGGNLVTTYTGAITLALAANPGAGTLSGTNPVSAVGGVAVFSDLSIDNLADGYTLSASAAGLAPAVSNAFDVAVPPEVNAWLNVAGGNWSTPTNWSRGTVPTAADTVWITQSGTYTVNVDVSTTFGRLVVGGSTGTQTVAVGAANVVLGDSLFVGTRGALEVGGSTLSGAGTALVDGSFSWTGGNLAGGGGEIRVGPTGTLTIAGTATRTLSQFTLSNAGTGIWSGAHQISSGNSGTIRVLPGGTLDIQGSPRWAFNMGGGVPLFDVQGTVTQTAASDTTQVPGLAVSGALVVASGVFDVTASATTTGTLTVNAGAALRFSAGTSTLSLSSLVQGAGEVHITGGTVTSSGGWAVTGLTRQDGGTFNFANGVGTTGAFELNGGTKGGGGTFVATGSLVWTGGLISGSAGITRLDAGGTGSISGAAARGLSNHTLELGGAVVWTGDAAINSGSAGTIRVLAGGSLDIQGDPTWLFNQGGAQSSLDVQGALTRSTSTGTAVVPGLAVSGTALVTSGVLEARNTSTSTGTLTVAAGAELRFTGAPTFSASSLVDGAGLVSVTSGTATAAGGWGVTGTTALSGGTFAFNGTGTTTNFNVVGGTKAGSGILTVTGAMIWSGGNLQGGGGITRVAPGGTLLIDGTATRTLSAHALEVGGTGVWSDVQAINSGSVGIIRVLAGGSLDIQGDPTWLFNQGGGQSLFEVQGALTRSTSLGTAIVPGLAVSGTALVSSGVLEARSTSTSTGNLTVAAGAEFRLAGTLTFGAASLVDGAGTVTVASGTNTAAGGWGVTGTTVVSGGTFNFDGIGSTGVFSLVGGTKAGSGTFTVTGAMTWSGGNLQGGDGITRVAVGGTLLINGATTRNLNAHVLEIGGAGVWTGTQAINSGSAGTLRVLASGTLDIQGDPTWLYNQGGAAAVFDVAGVVTRTVSAGTAVILSPNLSGTLTVNTGVLELRYTSTVSGAYSVQAPAELRFGSGTQTLTGASSVTGPGLVTFVSGATVTSAGGWGVTGTTRVSGGTFNYDGVGATAVLELASGNKGGSGTLVVNTSLLWTGGNFQGGGGVTQGSTSAVTTISGATTRNLSAHTLEIAGVGIWTGSANINSGSGALLRVAVGGSLDIQGDPTFAYNLGGATVNFVLLGTLTRSTSVGAAIVSVPTTFAGPVNITSGTLDMRSGGVLGGTAVVAAGSFLRFGGGTFAMQPGYASSGAGIALIDGATLNGLAATDTVTFTNLTAQTGSLAPSAGAVVRVDADFQWSGGAQLTGGGTTHIPALALGFLSSTSARSLSNHTLDVEGQLFWVSAFTMNSGSGAVIRIRPSGILALAYPVATTATYAFNLGGGPSLLDMQGLMTMSPAATFTVTAPVSLTGITNILDGTVNISGGGTIANTFFVDTPAAMRFSAGTITLADGLFVSGLGSVELDGASFSTATATDTADFARLRLASGQINAPGVVRVANLAEWTGGANLQGGATLIAEDSLLINGGAARSIANATIETRGLTEWSSAAVINSGSGARIRNAASGAFNWSGNGTFAYNLGGGTSFLENLGTLDISGAGTSVLSAFLVDTVGSGLTISGGTTQMTGGGRLGGVIGTNGILSLNGGTFSLKNGFQSVAAAGSLRLNGATITTDSSAISTSVQVDVFEHFAGVLAHEGLVEVTGSMTWTGGNLTSNTVGLGGTTRILPGATMLIGGAAAKSLVGAHLLDLGAGVGTVFNSTVVVNTGSGASISNAGLFDLQGPGAIAYSLGGGQGSFTNLAGAELRSSGATTGAMGLAVNSPGGSFTVTGDTLRLVGGSVTNFYGTAVATSNPIAVTGSTVTLTGAFDVSGPASTGAIVRAGTLALNGNTMTVAGDFVTAGTGVFSSTGAAALLDVAGNVVFQSGSGSAPSAGELRVGGDFTQGPGGSASGFDAGGTHRTVFDGAGTQNISISGTSSRFNVLEIAPIFRSVVLQTNVDVVDSLIMLGGLGAADLIGAGATQRLTTGGTVYLTDGTQSPRLAPPVLEMTVAPDIAPIGSAGRGLTPDTAVYVNPAVTALPTGVGIRYNSVRLATSAIVTLGTDTIANDLHISSGSGRFTAPATFLALGKLRTSGSGTLGMLDAAANVTVTDSAVFSGGNSNGILTLGTLQLRGDFSQPGGNAAAFSASGAHVTDLFGTALQSVFFTNPGTTVGTSHFADLRISNKSVAGTMLSSPVFAVNQLLSVGLNQMSLVSSSTGDSLWIGGIAADSIIFDNLPLRLAGTAPLGGSSDFVFQNMDPAVDHWVITRAGGSFSPNWIVFSTVPNAGSYNLVVNNTSASPLTLTINSVIPIATMIGPPPRYLLTGTPLPVVTWNASTLP